jgi:lipocalin
MIATAVSPIAIPPRILPGSPWTLLNSTPKAHAEIMNVPSAAASIRYSGQWLRTARTP